ncbi:MAG: HD domain-containing protein [Phycisphaerales bacterium]|nr:HD domain-containing protein [Phycisphaerales bacterium]
MLSPEIVQSLVKIIELKDASTAAHTWRVVLYLRTMAEEAKIDHDTIGRLTTAAALHDFGKIDIPDEVLQKPGKLTDDEFEVMKQHTVLGHERLVQMGVDDPVVLNLVRHHHERHDGLGYPDRLGGDRIPLLPRYFAVIDSFDAMTSIRPYRKEVGEEAAKRALAEIHAGAGTRYAPDAVEVFSRLYDSGQLDWILHYFNDQCPVPAFEHGPALQKRKPETAKPA